jgi:hypothetical protein
MKPTTKPTRAHNLIPTLIRGLILLTLAWMMLASVVEPASAALCPSNTAQYRSATSGIWADNATWQVSLDGGATWGAAGCWPSSVNGLIRVRNGHTVTLDTSLTLDQFQIDTGGRLVINSGVTMTIANGSGTDLLISGTLENAGTIAGVGQRLINPGSLYRHMQDGGTILSGVWSATSTIEILGVVSTMPLNFNQTFGNVIWNSSGQTANTTILGNMTAAGDFSILDTGTGQISVADATNRTITVAGDFTLSGGTLNVSMGTAQGRINVAGNFTHSGGTITNSGSNLTSGFYFNGSTVQTYTSGGMVTNVVNFTVNAGAILHMGTSTITGGGRFLLNAGGMLGIGSPDGITTAGTAAGNIQTATRTFTLGGNYLYNGTSDQVTGTGFPTDLTGDLIINNPGHTVTLNNPRRIANGGLISISDGVFATGANLTMGTTSSIYRSGGSMSGTPQGSGVYDVFYTGNSMTSTAELDGSGLHNVSITLNSGETLTLGGALVVDGDLAIIAGALDSADYAVTFNGSFSNAGTFDAGNSAITIGGSSALPTIAGFSTSGPLAFTRSASSATLVGDVSAGSLSLNGAGGTLDLGSGRSHQVQGNVTLSAGTLVANDSALGVGGNWTYQGGSFVAGSGTVTFNGSAPQAISGSVTDFNILAIAPDAVLEIPLTNPPTIASAVLNSGSLRQTATLGTGGSQQFLNLQSSGGAPRYRGLDFTSTSGEPGTVTVNVRGNQAYCDAYDFLIHRCFNLTVSGSPTANVTFYYEDAEINGSSCELMEAYHWNGSTWDAALPLELSFYTDGRLCAGEGGADGSAANPWGIQVSGVTDFSPFGVTSGGSPTAVQLVSLSVKPAGPALPVAALAIIVVLGGAILALRRR